MYSWTESLETAIVPVAPGYDPQGFTLSNLPVVRRTECEVRSALGPAPEVTEFATSTRVTRESYIARAGQQDACRGRLSPDNRAAHERIKARVDRIAAILAANGGGVICPRRERPCARRWRAAGAGR